MALSAYARPSSRAKSIHVPDRAYLFCMWFYYQATIFHNQIR